MTTKVGLLLKVTLKLNKPHGTEGYATGGAEWKHSCPRDDAGDRICAYSSVTAHRSGYDEGFDTAMTNFEADERIIKMTDEAYGNGYTCGDRQWYH